MSKKAWQVPISGQLRAVKQRTAHWFEKSSDKSVQVLTACGRAVTAGFAKTPRRNDVRCKECTRKKDREQQ